MPNPIVPTADTKHDQYNIPGGRSSSIPSSEAVASPEVVAFQLKNGRSPRPGEIQNPPAAPEAPIPATAPAETKVAPTATESAAPSTYQIKSGDTLSKIAAANGTNIQAIMAANPTIKNPNLIYAGKSLNLPGAPKTTPATDTANKYQNDLHAKISTVADTSDAGKVAAAAASVPYGDTSLTPGAQTTVDGLIGTISKQITDLNAQTPVSLVDNYKQLSKDLGLDELNTEYINTQNIINGTEDDIRAEVTKAGGTMSESQVEALAAARNKSLILKANGLQAAIATKTDTLNTLSGLSKDQQTMANDRVNTAIGLEQSLLTTTSTLQTHATDGYNKIVTNVGYKGLAGALAGDPYSQSLAEKSLLLPPGTLSNPAALSKLDTYREQQLAMSQQKINISIGNTGSANGSTDDLAKAMMNGQIAPSQIPGYGKNSLRSQVEAAVLKEDPNFDFTRAESNFSFEKSVKTQSTQASLRYTVDTLTQLKGLSDKVDRGKITYGNQAGQWLGYKGSDPDTVAFVTKVNGAVDDVAAALGGGVSTDAKLAIAKQLLDPTLSQEAFNVQVDTDLATIASRQAALDTQSGNGGGAGAGGLSLKDQIISAGYNYDAIKKDNPKASDQDIFDSIQ